ncbi:PilZ domain-containing protein [Pleionea sediminis]|uniref:PilZ domain-containing protein n=1 Tax=Pleionea sediminis TaxID=2569479 RepID=UPI001186FD85|nr:PilZ domain-containing protein [Pleionea sediminis]
MGHEESRKEQRVDKQETVFIEILATSAESDSGLVVKCATQDISRTGIKVNSNFPITVGAYLELLIDFESTAARFLLTGEVKWCRQIDSEPTYECGFELLEAEHSDIQLWQAQFDNVT